MIEPDNITKLNRTPAEKQEFLIFCVLCAGKSSEQQATKLNQFLIGADACMQPMPFNYVAGLIEHDFLRSQLEYHKIGKYDLMCDSLYAMTQSPECTEWDRNKLVAIPGISYKTASLYRMHAFGDRLACLDTHILKYMKKFIGLDVPKGAPQQRGPYERIELLWLGYAYKLGLNSAALDLWVWNNRDMLGDKTKWKHDQQDLIDLMSEMARLSVVLSDTEALGCKPVELPSEKAARFLKDSGFIKDGLVWSQAHLRWIEETSR